MRPRTFLLIILVLILAAAAVVLFLVLGGGLDVAGLLGNGEEAPVAEETAGEEAGVAQPEPTATPEVRFVPVVVTRVEVPAGARIQQDYVEIELRPETNIAVQAGYTFGEVEDVAGRIARVSIARGQSVLNSMIALNPSDLATMGSDLALYVDQGRVAIAVPINRYSGAAYAMRPGDLVDMIMSLQFVAIDEDFQTARPNFSQRVDPFALQEGRQFLFETTAEGRLELIPGVNIVATIGPAGQGQWGYGELLQIPRRVTQLTIQQAEVLWVGTWQLGGVEATQVQTQPAAGRQGQAAQAEGQAPAAQATPEFVRRERQPDMVILSLTPQDALALKWAMDRGIEIDLALRGQGDTTVFATSSVSLPQMVEQGGLTIPERGEFDIHPRADEVDPPSLSPVPLGQSRTAQ